MSGKKYLNPDIVYISWTKHYCPNCKNKLKTVKVSKIVNRNSPEAKDYDFSSDIVLTGDVEFIWKEFECPQCHKHYSVNELKKTEGIEITSPDNPHIKTHKKQSIWDFIIFCLIAVVILYLFSLFKK